jgi:thymidine phosphorylase
MISGRGLGHTGGTTDKAECIPGYDATPDFATFRKTVRDVGCAIIGQTTDLAPADRRFYSIRDVTGTVESVPLITASILAKKIAAGLQGLVMDVKMGSGAFMDSVERAQELARSIIATAAKAGLKTHALITDMNEVLGSTAGNALEIREAVLFLRNEQRESRLDEVTISLCAEMLVVGGIESDLDRAREKCDDAVTSGRAAEVFGRMVKALGAVGNAIIELGGGRRKVGEDLDLSVGFSDIASIGEALEGDRPLAVIHAASEADADKAEKNFLSACELGESAPDTRPVIYEILAD